MEDCCYQTLNLGSGALKADLFDVTSSDASVSTFLQGTLHKQTCPDDISDQLGAIEGLDIDVHDDTCLNGMCRSSPFWPEVCKMAKALSYKLDEHGIKAGSLLHFSSDSSPAVAAAFLGVIIKKPLMQTFIEAKVDDSQASFAMDPKGRVRVFSAHEMFDTMLGLAAKQGLNPLLFEIKVEVWQCELFVYESRCLRVRVEDIAVVFSVSCNPPKKADAKKKQADPSLPFGLELEKKKRRKRRKAKHTAKGQPSKAQQPAKERKEHAATSEGTLPSGSYFHPDVEQGQEDSDLSDSNSSGSDTSKSDPDEKDEQLVEPISETMRVEVASVSASLADIAAAQESREEVQNMCRASGSKQPSTFFSREVGLGAEHGPASSGRSKCHVCHQLIQKGSCRFQWWWNTRRPNAWLHPYCVISAADNINLRGPTVSKLRLISTSFEIASVQAEAHNILESLL